MSTVHGIGMRYALDASMATSAMSSGYAGGS